MMNLKNSTKYTVILMFTIILAQFALAETGLQCNTRQYGCVAGETEIFRYDGINLGGMHAQLPGPLQTYANTVCCSIRSGAIQITNTCDKPFNTTILKLADTTDSHVEIPGIGNNYQNNICIGTDSVENSKITCTYLGECTASQTCLASISSNESKEYYTTTDLHVANCSANPAEAYVNKICCSSGPLSTKTYINGTVTDVKGNKLKSANVSAYYPHDPVNSLSSILTDVNGFYVMNVSRYAYKPSMYLNLIVKYSNYLQNIKENNNIIFDETTKIDFIISEGQGCLADCTMANDDKHLCNPACEGVNGCSYSPESKMACTNPRQVKGARKILNDNLINQSVVYCCSGSPVVENKNTNTSIICPGKEMVKMTKIVIIDGEPVKMNVVACSNNK